MRPELRPLLERLRLPFWHREDIEGEIAGHLQEVEADLRVQGLGESEAHQAALERLGDLDSLGDSLQAVHQGWSGGATVERRFATAVVTVVALCALAAAWTIFVVESIVVPWRAADATRSGYESSALATAARESSDAMRFQPVLVAWSMDHPRVTWMGIMDKGGVLHWSQPPVSWAGQRLPGAEAFLPEPFTRDAVNILSGAADQAGPVRPLTRQLAIAHIPVVRYEALPLGGYSKGRYIGTAIIAYGPPLWSAQVVAVLTHVWLWYGLIWLLSPLIMLAHRRQHAAARGWDWAIVAFFFGPPIWFAYGISTLSQRLSGRVSPQHKALAIVPIAGVVLTVLMLVGALWPALYGAVDLYAIRPERGAETLSHTPSGVRVLLGAAESGQYLVRQAAVRSLSRVASPEQGTSMLASWTRMLDSKYPETRQLGWQGLQQSVTFRGWRPPADDLFRAWKAALGSKYPDTRRAAWTQFSLSLTSPKGFPYHLEGKIPALLALGANDAILYEYYSRWLQYGQTVHGLGQVRVGSTRQFTVDVRPSPSYLHPERAQRVARTSAPSPHIQTSFEELGDGASPVVRLHVAYSAHGPVGVHHERVNLLAERGRLIGVVDLDLRIDEVAAR